MEVSEWLRRVAGSEMAERCLVRGSQLTRLWVPERRANDVDHLLLGEWTVGQVRDAFWPLAPESLCEVTWAETPFPGVRISTGRLQIDLGWGDPLVAAPVPVTVCGVETRGVVPEVMLGWKLHGLFEHGRGRWHAKTLADAVLLMRRLKLDEALAERATRVAFESRGTGSEELARFLDDPTWGQSRGSRNKWRSYRKKAPWVDFELAEAIEVVRASRILRLGRPGE